MMELAGRYALTFSKAVAEIDFYDFSFSVQRIDEYKITVFSDRPYVANFTPPSW